MTGATLESVSLDNSGPENGAIGGWKTEEWENRLSRSGSLQVSGADLSGLSGYLSEVSKEANVPSDITVMKSWVDGMRLAGVEEKIWETARCGPVNGALYDPDKILEIIAQSGFGGDQLTRFLIGGDKVRYFDVQGIYPIGGNKMDVFQMSKLLLTMAETGDKGGEAPDRIFQTAAMGVVYRAMVETGMSGWIEQGKPTVDSLIKSVGGREKAKNLIIGTATPDSYFEKCFVQIGKLPGFDAVFE